MSLTPRRCQLDWYDSVQLKMTSHVKDIQANCTNGNLPFCNFPNSEKDGFLDPEAKFECTGVNLFKNPAPTRPRDKAEYICSCGNDKIKAPDPHPVIMIAIPDNCRDPCFPLQDKYSCGLIIIDNPYVLNESFHSGPKGVVSESKSMCATLRCGSKDESNVLRGDNTTVCTDEKGLTPYRCDGLVRESYLNDSQSYLCNCQGIPEAQSLHVSNPGERDLCKGKYGLTEKGTSPPSGTSGGASEPSGTGSSSSKSSGTSSSAGVPAINMSLKSLKTVVGWATASLFMVGLVA